MNATPEAETPQQAARRLAQKPLSRGFVADGLHVYTDEKASPVYWRIRLKHPDTGEKWIRPMHLNGTGFELGEPKHAPAGKPLYRLHELAKPVGGKKIFITEGEKKSDLLAAKCGVLTTTSGASDSAAAADWNPLAERHCIVWPDNDGAGLRYAGEVVDQLQPLGCTVEVIDPAKLGLSAKGDAADWLALHPNATAEHLDRLPRADIRRFGGFAPAPEPLRRPVAPAEPYPVAELGHILGEACECLRRVVQAPDAICGASLLAAASLAAQALGDVELDGRFYPLSLWLLTIAESGERKSAVDAEAMRAARAHEKKLAGDYTPLIEIYAANLAQWEARREDAKKVARRHKGEGLAAALRDIGPAPPAPLVPIVAVADFTAEGLAKLLAAGQPSVGAFTDEAALVFGGHGMTKETITRTAGTLSKLWDAGTLDRVRATDANVKLYGRRLALHLMAQPVIAERALSDDVLTGQGFLARCLLSWPSSTAGTRPYVAESLAANSALVALTKRLRKLHEKPLPVSSHDRQELAPPRLHLEHDAAELWRTLHDSVEAGMAPNGRFATVRPWASKTPEQCLRIAGVLTVLEHDDATTIDAATIERAAELALWHLNEAARLSGTAELSAEVRDAEALLQWAHATGRTMLHSGAALRLGPARIRERERFMQAMGELERAGWAIRVEGGAEVDGAHRKNVWRISPAAEGR